MAKIKVSKTGLGSGQHWGRRRRRVLSSWSTLLGSTLRDQQVSLGCRLKEVSLKIPTSKEWNGRTDRWIHKARWDKAVSGTMTSTSLKWWTLWAKASQPDLPMAKWVPLAAPKILCEVRSKIWLESSWKINPPPRNSIKQRKLTTTTVRQPPMLAASTEK